MRKIPTNSSAHAAQGRAAARPLRATRRPAAPPRQHRLYQALCHAIVGGIAKPGEPLPPSRTLARQTGFRRNAVTTAYERLIADGFAVASPSAPAPSSPPAFQRTQMAHAARPDRDRAAAARHLVARLHAYRRQGLAAFPIVCRAADARVRDRASALRRSQRQPRTSHRDRRSFAVGARAALRSRPDHADVGNAARACGSC